MGGGPVRWYVQAVPHAVLARPGSSPARIAVAGAGAVLICGTALLMLPVSSADGTWTGLVDSLFTAVSAMSVTGLVVLDPAHWTTFGQVVILLLIQIGGTGVMTLATLLGLVTMRRLGLRARVTAGREIHAELGDAGAVVRGIVVTSLLIELVVAAILFTAFALRDGLPVLSAAGSAVFHAVSAFNNAGFSLHSDSLIRYADDPLVALTLAAAVVAGGLGFPVIAELLRRRHGPRHWTLTTKLVLTGTPILLLAGLVTTLLTEHSNPGTLGPMDWPQKVLNALLHSVFSRTAGFNSVDVGAMREETWLSTVILMLIGGGPAGTAGGLKITTVLILVLTIRSELRGDSHVIAFGKRLPQGVNRQVVTVVGLMSIMLLGATAALMALEDHPLDRVLFEVASAISTTGLSTGITPQLSDASCLILALLMFVGRVGPISLGTALALRPRPLLYEPPKERPLIG